MKFEGGFEPPYIGKKYLIFKMFRVYFYYDRVR